MHVNSVLRNFFEDLENDYMDVDNEQIIKLHTLILEIRNKVRDTTKIGGQQRRIDK